MSLVAAVLMAAKVESTAAGDAEVSVAGPLIANDFPRLGRLRLRGPRGAQDEFVLAAIAQNLRRLASLVARPPPYAVQCIA